MYLRTLYVRFYKSFNYDYLRKFHPSADRDPWDDFDGLWYPHVRVRFDPRITTVVGANETGKSHLLSAIEKGITGKGIEPQDFCRYSHFFSVEEGKSYWPQFGFEWSDLSETEQASVRQALGLSSFESDRFLMFRTEPDRVTVYVPVAGAPYSVHELDEEHSKSLSAVLPKPFRIDPDIALPESVPIAWLIESEEEAGHSLSRLSRRQRFRFFETVRGLNTGWFQTAATVQQQAGKIFSTLGPVVPREQPDNDEDERTIRSYELARDLLFKVARVDRDKLRHFYDAVRDGHEGHAGGLIQRINDQLSKRLNFPYWWAQDRDFCLTVSPREMDLVFTIQDRTGTQYSFNERSSGLKYFLSYYVQYRAHAPSPNQREILLMDEPDAFLSADAQQDLLKIFQAFAYPDTDVPSVQVAFVTHSPFLIDKNHSERIRVLEKGAGDEGTRVVSNAAQNHYEPLRSAFGAFVGETTFIGNCNLVVEGPADQILIAGAASLIRRQEHAPSETVDLNRVTLVPAGSASHVPYMVYLARGRDVEQPAVVVLLDSDAEGTRAAKRLRRGGPDNRPLLENKYVLMVGDLSVPNIEPKIGDSATELEDMVPLELAVEAANRYLQEFIRPGAAGGSALDVDQARAKLDAERGIFGAISTALEEMGAESDWHVEKMGFARQVIEAASDRLDRDEKDELATRFLANMRALFSRVNQLRRAAEKELFEEKLIQRVERLKNRFLQDHPNSSTREEASILLEEVEAILDNSPEADSLRVAINTIRRDFHLGEDLALRVPRFDELRARLDALKYSHELVSEGGNGP